MNQIWPKYIVYTSNTVTRTEKYSWCQRKFETTQKFKASISYMGFSLTKCEKNPTLH